MNLESDYFGNHFLDSLRDSFWPNGIWYASAPNPAPAVRSAKDKADAKAEAKRLLHAQAPEGLKLALGANGGGPLFILLCFSFKNPWTIKADWEMLHVLTATVDALDRLHETLQGESASKITATVLLDLVRILLL